MPTGGTCQGFVIAVPKVPGHAFCLNCKTVICPIFQDSLSYLQYIVDGACFWDAHGLIQVGAEFRRPDPGWWMPRR